MSEFSFLIKELAKNCLQDARKIPTRVGFVNGSEVM